MGGGWGLARGNVVVGLVGVEGGAVVAGWQTLASAAAAAHSPAPAAQTIRREFPRQPSPPTQAAMPAPRAMRQLNNMTISTYLYKDIAI